MLEKLEVSGPVTVDHKKLRPCLRRRWRTVFVPEEPKLSGWLWVPGMPKNHYYGVHPNGWSWPLCGNGNALILNPAWAQPRAEDDPDNCKMCLRLLRRRAREVGEDRQ